jgi:hypothetical protein
MTFLIATLIFYLLTLTLVFDDKSHLWNFPQTGASVLHKHIFYTFRNEVGGGGGYTGFSMSVCPSVHPLTVFCFPDIFWIDFADNEVKLDMIVCDNN